MKEGKNEERYINKPITIDLAVLKKLSLTPSQYFLAYCIYNNYRGSYEEIRLNYGHEETFKEDLYQLIKKKYLKVHDPEKVYYVDFDLCTINGIFTTPADTEMDWDEFVDTFRDTFPSGVKSGGFYVKSSKIDIEKRLKKFIKEYKFPKEIILEAVKQYVEESALGGYKYMKLAHYLIYKNNESMLASACDALQQSESDTTSVSSIFNHKI